MEHSKLPWELDSSNSVLIIWAGEMNNICEVETLQDAEFIVRACNAYPAMLEALELMLTFRGLLQDCECSYCKATKKVKTAVTLAKGEN